MVFDFGAENVFSGTFYFHTMNNFNMGEFFFELRVYFQPPPFRYLYLPTVRCLRGGGMGTTEVL